MRIAANNNDKLRLTPLPPDGIWTRDGYVSSDGTVHASWESLKAELTSIMAQDGIPFDAPHDLLMQCPEYRAVISTLTRSIKQ